MCYTTLPVEEHINLALGWCVQVTPDKVGYRTSDSVANTVKNPEQMSHPAREEPFCPAFCLKGTFVGEHTRFLSLTPTSLG